MPREGQVSVARCFLPPGVAPLLNMICTLADILSAATSTEDISLPPDPELLKLKDELQRVRCTRQRQTLL